MINLFLPKPTAPKKLTWQWNIHHEWRSISHEKMRNFPASHFLVVGGCFHRWSVDSPHHTGAWGVRGTCEKKCCWTSFTDDLGSFWQSCKITWPKQPSWMIHWYTYIYIHIDMISLYNADFKFFNINFWLNLLKFFGCQQQQQQQQQQHFGMTSTVPGEGWIFSSHRAYHESCRSHGWEGMDFLMEKIISAYSMSNIIGGYIISRYK